jgi:hypothetical protein
VALALAAGVLVFHLATSHGYGWFRDELYYIVCSERPAAGYVDFPPLLALALRPWRAIAGESLLALRTPPALAAATTVWLTGRVVQALGGGRRALATALLPVALAPIYLGTFGILTPNAFDVVCWTAALLVCIHLLDGGGTRDWLALGALLGVGFLMKHGIAALGIGLAVGLLLTPARRHLVTRGPYLAAAVATLIVLPHLVWQARHGWPTLEFVANARALKNLAQTPLAFVAEQVLVLLPVTAPIWIAGLVSLWRRNGGRWRALAWAYVMILGLMIASGGKAYYLTPFYPLLFAAGGVAFERARGGRWLTVVVPALVLVVGAAFAPLAKPLLSEEAFVPYAAALGQDPRAGIDERHPLGVLPQHFADQHGWPELAARVAEVHRRLSPDERAAACIFTANYGEAAAVDVFGRALGLPSAISGHNTYWLWGPHDCDFSTVIVVGFDAADVRDFVGSVEVAAHVTCPYCMPYEQRDVLVTHGLTLPRDALWRRVKHYL